MNNNKLVFRYSFLFLILSTISLVVLLFSKANLIEKQKEDVQVKNKNIINLYKKKSLDVSELFFFTYVHNNKNLENIIKSSYSKEEKFASLDKLYEKKLTFFKKHHLKEINFYALDGTPLYKSSFEKYNKNLSNEYKKEIQEVSKEFNSKVILSVNDTNASIQYLRTIFDKNLNPLAIFEVSMDLPKLVHETFIEKNFQIDFIFDRLTLKKRVNKEFIKNYSPHYINPNFMYQNSFYTNRFITKKIPSEALKQIREKMKNMHSFVVDYRLDDKYYITSFIPVSDYSYLMLNVKCDEYENIVKRYDLYIYVLIATIFIITLLLFIINLFYNRFRITKSKLDSISKSIDKYVIVAETDLRGTITYVSEAFCNVSGYKKDELIGKSINVVRHPDISKRFYENMWSKLSNDEVWEGEIKNIDKNGNSYWVRGNILPIYDLKNEKVGYRSIRVNISDEKQLLKVNSLLKRDLFLKLNEIKTRDRMNIDQSKIVLMGQILDAFSNEWKKPISNLSSKILAFENSVAEDSYNKNYLNTLAKELGIELKILSMHLNEFKTLFSHNSSEDKYNVYNAIKTAIASVSQKDVTISLLGDETLETFGVSYDLRKIILGIIYNSIEEFRKKKIPHGKITITINKTNDNLLIKCKDNAGGIPQEFLSKIFETGFSTKENLSSRGLPLHIAKLIVRKLDGDIWAKNEDNGCCFYIKLITKDRRENRREQ
ncbi:PAS domain S-box protein [Halarcobacter bivalviorum]|uniref:histidine kinase n=1 Tax=Halarcobacter bivalviorum TaxID=663364 RepID=A0AAX2A9C6_9BACT|nr:PAS domain S-box protein [Halarcobacter bivalviorum]AXH11536.1 PAS sensor-containing two-component system histidine kinase [Halarcobacter bivalviorum]RXK09281.1 hypothetical protein CRV05_10140 [Halarcobacter bivalviorum]